jgi:redox-sensitive bicupin YhaK (pirin superfamily)
VYRGEVAVADTRVPQTRMAILANSAEADGVTIEAIAPSRLLLIGGRPLGEPIVQYGPFVMNSERQIHQAVDDFRAGRLA